MTGTQRLHRDAVYVYGAYILRYLSVLILVPYYGRVLGPTGYGDVLASMSVMSLVWMLVNYGFSTTGTREVAARGGDGLREICAKQLSARLMLLPFGLLLGLVATLASPTLKVNPWTGIIATLLGVLNAFNLGWLYQGLRRFRLSMLFEAMVYPLNIMFILLLVKGPNDTVKAMAGLLASTTIVTASAYIVASRIVRPGCLSLSRGWMEIKAASVIFVQSVNDIVMTSGSTYVLSVFSTAPQVGYFGSVEKLVNFGLAFLQPAAQVLIPNIVHSAEHVPDEHQRLVRTGIVFNLAYGLTACLGSFFLASFIIPIAFGPNFGPSVPILRIMALAFPLAALTHAIGCYVFIPLRKERSLVLSVVIGNVCNLAIVASLAIYKGGIGVAIARVVAELVTASCMVFFLRRMTARTDRLAPKSISL